MWAFFDIIRFSAGSILWGVLIALLCMAAFVFIIKGWWKNAVFTVGTYIVGAVLFILLSVQCVLICGSIKIINTTDIYEERISAMLSGIDGSYMLSMEENDKIIGELTDRYPILENYIGGGDFSGHKASDIPHVMADELRSFMKEYIVRRLLWCLGFVVVAGVIAVKTITLENSMRRSAPRRSDRTRVMPDRSSRRHVRRRR